MERKRIMFIHAVGHDHWDSSVKDYLEKAKNETTEVEVVSMSKGPHHLEYHYYGALVAAELLHTIKRAEKDGFDAAVIGCFYDPFIYEAREICERMIVTAPAESSLQLATVLGDSFSIIVGRKKWIPVMRRNAIKYGYGEKLASFRSLELGVMDFQADKTRTRDRIIKEAKKAVEDDGAEVIIMGCTDMQYGFFRELQEILGVPVIDVLLAPFKHAEFLVDLRDRFGWGISKIKAYETPPFSEIKGWRLEEQYGIPGLWDK